MAMTEISDTADFLDVRDVIKRVEELRKLIAAYAEKMDDWQANADNVEELERLEALLGELKGCGGDHEWRGAWYPVTLIRDDYFETYAREFAEDIGAVGKHNTWPTNHIDWKAAAEALQQDYTQVDFGESTYWYR
jgi:hypothetical protein